jgi:hypothetical protein
MYQVQQPTREMAFPILLYPLPSNYYNSPTRITFSAVEPKMQAFLIAQQYAYNTSSRARGKGACGAKE